MKTLSTYITEGLKIGKKYRQNKTYNYHPKNKKELHEIIEQLLKERGNDANLNDIDTSVVTDMSALFSGLDPHNIDISEWDVSNVTNMKDMFYNCKSFNSDLSEWDVSNVTNMSFMFDNCYNFISDLSDWDVSSVTYMSCMFMNCKSFNSDLSEWDVSNVTDPRNMGYMFFNCWALENKPSWYKVSF